MHPIVMIVVGAYAAGGAFVLLDRLLASLKEDERGEPMSKGAAWACAIFAAALLSTGASCREFGIGFGEGVVAGVADEFTPRPTPSRPPVVIEPTPTFTPNPTPTVTPNPPVPTPTQTPGPASTATPPVVTPAPGAGCKPAPEPPDTPVSLLFPQGCPQGFEPALRNYCTVKAGCTTCTSSGGSEGPYTYEGKPARVVVETVAGMAEGNLRIVDGAWLACDVTPFGMDCHDAYGRLIRNGRPYVHPEGWTAPYTFSYTALPLTKCPETPTPTPAAGPTPTPVAPGACPPLHLVQWDVLRIASKEDRQTVPRTGQENNPAKADTDIIVGSITPKMTRPYCPNGRVICELTKECQDQLVGFPKVTQTLPGAFFKDPVVHNSSNAFITFMNLAPGETGRYEIEACTEAGTHCTTSYVWVE